MVRAGDGRGRAADGGSRTSPRCLLYCPRCRRSVTFAPRARPSGIIAATRWWRPAGASIPTSSGSASTTVVRHDACTCARGASRPARSPKLAERRGAPDWRGTRGGRFRASDRRGQGVRSEHRPLPGADRGRAGGARGSPRGGQRPQRLSRSPTATPATTWSSPCGPCSPSSTGSSGRRRGRARSTRSAAMRSSPRSPAPRCSARAATPGVILSQLIRGAAEELASRPGELVDPVLIGAALARAADQAYGSVREPAEGTILTVVREMAQPGRLRARPHGRRPAGRGRHRRRAGPGHRRRDRERAGCRPGIGQARAGPAAGAARGGRGRRRRLRPDRAAGGHPRRAARLRAARGWITTAPRG